MKVVSRRAIASDTAGSKSLPAGAVWRRRGARCGLAHAARAITGPESPTFVKAVVAPSEIGQDLVADGAHPSGEVVDAHAVADQGGKIAAANGAGREIGDVDRQQVHRYPASERTALSGDDDLGRRLASGGAGRP